MEIADLGSSDVNGSYRQMFGVEANYTGLDLESGPGVDMVLDDPHRFPFENNSIDLILSGQMLEHSAQFWRVFTEMARVLKSGGLAFVIAPSAGPIHRFPVDCYRFYPDAFQALADWSRLRLVHCWLDERGPWRDLVGVFQRGGNLQPRTGPPAPSRVEIRLESNPDKATELTQGARPYLDVLSDVHAILQPKLYIEIGVRKGASLALAGCAAVAIDPDPDLPQIPDNVAFYRCSSDDFFFFHGKDALRENADLAFIDGLHHADVVLRDFMNIERYMQPHGVIIVDDVLPNHPTQAQRDRQSKVWCGDVWRIIPILQKLRPELKLTLLDSHPTGMLIVSNLNSHDQTLWGRYNPTVRQLLTEQADPPDEILSRGNAIAPLRSNICKALGIVNGD